ncbi:oligosaccharide biosynthesis protein Alg14-like protein [Roseivivax marinus]|uniref:Oligosaccharide biosynthesis protein Alg14-like protein n=3 Tax=Roseivivax marinus TaxID=1379903 RepID=W4HM76_9RHOB|nr:UDP-N-acetylglucosamine--LPS N-acetylglucosamine transferase [Roseivivax marinus]ETW13216.1 oligosaccharide biosynthesis protein Alg14-like protein [Roseivivax marinus]
MDFDMTIFDTNRSGRKTRIFAIASAGGHWQQLMELRDAFEGCDVLYATTLDGLADQFSAGPAVVIPDCNRNSRRRAARSAWAILVRLIRFRPDVVITTGALPGVVALVLSKGIGARTIWVDSVANAERMSLSGMLARRMADLWVSQWPHVARATGARYFGAVL